MNYERMMIVFRAYIQRYTYNRNLNAKPNLARLAAAQTRRAICFATVLIFIFIFNKFCQNNYLKICRLILAKFSELGRTMPVDDQSAFSFSIPRETLPW